MSITLGWKSLMAQIRVKKLYDLSCRENSSVTYCCLGRHEQQNPNDLKRSNGGKKDDKSDGTKDGGGAVELMEVTRAQKEKGMQSFPILIPISLCKLSPMKSLDDSLIEEMQILSSFTSQTHSKHLSSQRSSCRTEKSNRKWNSYQNCSKSKEKENQKLNLYKK